MKLETGPNPKSQARARPELTVIFEAQFRPERQITRSELRYAQLRDIKKRSARV